jgi:hypothetical protein
VRLPRGSPLAGVASAVPGGRRGGGGEAACPSVASSILPPGHIIIDGPARARRRVAVQLLAPGACGQFLFERSEHIAAGGGASSCGARSTLGRVPCEGPSESLRSGPGGFHGKGDKVDGDLALP